MKQKNTMKEPRNIIIEDTTTTGYFPDEITTTEIHRGWFHGFQECPQCAIGDGSMIYIKRMAIIENEDGTVGYVEPSKIKFVGK